MSFSTNIIKNSVLGGQTVLKRGSRRNGSSNVVQKVTQGKALPGTLTTRTNNTDGTVTITGTNTITTGARLDLYWSGGQRHGVVVGTVSGQAVPITGGVGDNLPSATTVVQAAVPTQVTIAFVGNTVLSVAGFCDAYASFDFVIANGNDAVATAIYAKARINQDPSEGFDYTAPLTSTSQAGTVNPFAGATVTSCWVSHNDTAKAHDIIVGALLP